MPFINSDFLKLKDYFGDNAFKVDFQKTENI